MGVQLKRKIIQVSLGTSKQKPAQIPVPQISFVSHREQPYMLDSRSFDGMMACHIDQHNKSQQAFSLYEHHRISMRVFSASLATETNTFTPIPTGTASFEEFGLFRGDGSLKAPNGVGDFVHYIRTFAELDGHDVCESLAAWAEPGGLVLRASYETLRNAILEDLHRAMPINVVQLFLHGAMVAEGYDDCAGDLLSCIREAVGTGVAIGAELDLHCHFTERMRTAADALICFKEYPHTDERERAWELYKLLIQTAEGKVRPVTGVYDCKMVGLWKTTSQPMASFVARMKAFEGRDGILSVSLGHGFPWGDVADNGAKLWVIANDDAAKAEALAGKLGREFWDLRHEISDQFLTADSAIKHALATPGGPIVLADVADNPGAGAPGDSTFMLRALVDAGVESAAIGGLWDLGAVHNCATAGLGSSFQLRVGGKCGTRSGDPVDLMITVRSIKDEHSQRTLSGGRQPLGRSVWVETSNGIHILITSIRTQIFGTDAFTDMGIDLESQKIIVVKSMHHFRAEFSPIAKAIIPVTTPGAVQLDFANIEFRKRSLRYWPRCDYPHDQL